MKKKKLFVRFFKNKNDTLPFDSFLLCGQYEIDATVLNNELDFCWVSRHFRDFPDGKIDLVLL